MPATALVIDARVVTVDRAAARPPQATRTHSFASRLDTSRPAHRGCIRSMFLLPSATTATMSVPGRARKIQKSDARAQGNNPRFSWQPSATMLTYRLTGTTEESGVLPERTRPMLHAQAGRDQTGPAPQPRSESSRATVSRKGARMLTCTFSVRRRSPGSADGASDLRDRERVRRVTPQVRRGVTPPAWQECGRRRPDGVHCSLTFADDRLLPLDSSLPSGPVAG